jgi:hypothetical protein
MALKNVAFHAICVSEEGICISLPATSTSPVPLSVACMASSAAGASMCPGTSSGGVVCGTFWC